MILWVLIIVNLRLCWEVTVVRAFDTPIITGDQSIERVLAAGLPVVFVFLDEAASPALKEAMNRLAREQAGQLLVVEVPAKDNPASVRRYQISHLPAAVTVRRGQVLSKAGGISGADLDKHAAFLLGKGPQPAQPEAAGASSAQRPGGNAHPYVVTDATFEQDVLRSPQPVLVDFWAPWCGPCRIVAPVVEKLAQEMAGRLRVAKVNVDENPFSAQRYGVQGIPTMLVVKNGQVADRWVGALPEPALRGRVAAALRN
jgi:thioredoxin 1